MTADAQTQAIPRVPTPMIAARGPEAVVSEPEPEPKPEPEVALTESVQEMYEAALLKLETLHDHWAAAVAKISEAQVSGDAGEAAA